MSCGKEIVSIPTLTGCPADDELFFVSNALGGYSKLGESKGLAWRRWSAIKSCIAASFFGTGILTITGAQLDSSNIYLNSDLINDLVVFYNGVNRYLILGTEWQYVLNVDNDVVGVQILIPATFTSEDIFVIFPNPFA